TTQIHPGDEALTRITGAQTPSGIPITITTPAAERSDRAAASRGGAARGRRRAPAGRRAPARRPAA
ncbi:ATP-dependent helicase, partial [Streptomyces sp. NPDC006460]